jgi:site-specific recombinase XerC
MRNGDDPDAALPCWQEALALFTDIGSPERDRVRDLLRRCASQLNRSGSSAAAPPPPAYRPARARRWRPGGIAFRRVAVTLSDGWPPLAGFYRYAVQEGALPHSPVTHVRRPSVARDSQALGLDREEAVRSLAAAESASARDHALACLLTLNGLRVSEACAADQVPPLATCCSCLVVAVLLALSDR